jgi:hypothetical protein
MEKVKTLMEADSKRPHSINEGRTIATRHARDAASSRRHASRLAASPSSNRSETLSPRKHIDGRSPQHMCSTSETLPLSFAQRSNGATWRKNGTTGKTSNVPHGQTSQAGIELCLRTNLSTIQKAKIDVQSNASALEQSVCTAETGELKQERSNLS